MSMEPEEKRQLAETCNLVKELHRAVVGDPLDKHAPPGVLTQIADHHETLYGNRAKDIEGLVPQHNIMWKERAKVFAVVGAGVVLCGGVTWLLNFLKGH